MQALLDLLKTVYELSSLQVLYDTMEHHVRGLESLRWSHETYRDLLIPIVLGKLPCDMRTNLTRDHDSHEWKFQQFRESILKEIRILQAIPIQELLLQLPIHFSLKPKEDHLSPHNLHHQEQGGSIRSARTLTQHTSAV